MEEKIVISEFDLDITKLIKAASETKERIDALKTELKDLNKENDTASEKFVIAAVNLKQQNKEYAAQVSVLAKVSGEAGKYVPIAQRIDAAMQKEIKNIEDLRSQNKQLLSIRNQVDITTEEGQKQLAQLNTQIDKNTAEIKANVSEMEKQKMSIGGYADGIKEALAETNLFNSSFGEVGAVISKTLPLFKDLKGDADEAMRSFQGLTKGTEGMTASQKAAAIATNLTNASLKLLKVALIATGIGAFVVILASLVVYFQSSEAAGNKLSKLMGMLGAVFTKVMRILEPLGAFIADVLIAAFEKLGQIATKTISLVASGLKSLGFDKAANDLNRFNNEMSTAAKNAAALADAQAKLTKTEREIGLIRLQFQRDAEKQRQIRDDESKSMSERIAANEKLGKILENQLMTEQKAASEALLVANLRQSVEGEVSDVLDAQAQAREALFEIEERITGQQSEQLVNINSLRKEAAQQAADRAAKAKEEAQKNVEAMNNELALYIAKEGTKAKTLDQALDMEQRVAAKRINILDAELNSKLITQTEYNTKLLEMESDLAGRRAEIAVEAANKELSLLENRIELETAATKKVGQARLDQELQNEQVLRTERSRAAFISFQEGLTSETEYLDKVLALNQEYSLREVEILKATDELAKEQRSMQRDLDYQSRLITLENVSKDEFKIRAVQIEQTREQELEAARVKYTDAAMLAQAILNINGQANNAQAALEKEASKAKIESRLATLESVASIVGEETAIGKAAAAARTAMTTYEAAMSAYSALAGIPVVGPALGAAAAITVGAYGARNVAKIFSTDTSIPSGSVTTVEPKATQEQTVVAINSVAPFARGGKVRGGVRISRSNGDNVLATLKTGEVVLNERQQRDLGGDATFKALGIPGFATGGIVSPVGKSLLSSNTATVQNTFLKQVDSALADTIGDAVKEGARVGTQAGSRQGIVDLSTENYLRNLSSI